MTTRRLHFGSLVLLAALTAFVSLGRAGAQNAAVPDAVRGGHIAIALAGCADCHGATFAGGRAFIRDGHTVYAANLTGGAGGIAGYSNTDLRRAIRAGVRPDGTLLRVMPSREYAVMTDVDVDDLIAFLRSLPPVDATVPHALPAAAAAGARSASAGETPQPLAGGAYLATIGGCLNCHGANLAGTNRPGGIAAPNISRDGIGMWSFADFTTAMRTGKKPDGRTLAKSMPWESVGKMTDDELRTLYDYLQSKPEHAN